MRSQSHQLLRVARIVRFARTSLGIRFLVALTLSGLVWAGLTLDQNPNASLVFAQNLPIEPVGLAGENLVLVSAIPPVRVSVHGPKVTVDQLTRSDFVARVNLTGLPAGRHEVEVSVVVSDPSVEVLRITPQNVFVDLDPVINRTISITARVESAVASGFRADLANITADPTDAVITGAASVVERVANVQAALSLEGATQKVSVQALLIPTDRQGLEVTAVQIDPQTALVNVPVTRITGRKRVPVVAQIEGSAAPSFTVAQIGVIPTSVEIEGEPGALERVDAVQTLAIDISDAKADIDREVGFEIPAGVSILSNQPVVQVAIVVVPLEDTTTVQAAVVLTNIANGLQAIANQPSIQIVVSGPSALLQNLRGGDILAEVDLRNRATGLHQIRPVITNPWPDTLRIVQNVPEIVGVRIAPVGVVMETVSPMAPTGPGGTATVTPSAAD